MKTRPDKTIKKISMYGSRSWVAQTLGISLTKFKKLEPEFLVAGFPSPDSITGHYIKADVTAWINHRRKIPDNVRIADQVTVQGINFDGV